MAQKPTICIDASRISHDVATGTENVSAAVIRALIALPESASYRFLLYAPQRLPAGFVLCSEAEVHTRIVGTGRPWLLRFARALRGDKRVIDALYVPSHVVPPFGLPKRTVTMIHGMEWERAAWAYEWFERRRQAYATRHALHSCQTILTPSEATKQQLIAWAKQNDYIVPFIEVAPHGVPPLPESPDAFPAEIPLSLREKLDQQHAQFMVAIGRTDARKQLDVLTQAFHRSQCAQDKTHMLIAGPEGSGHAALQQTIDRLRMRERVHILGSVSNETKSWLLRHAAAMAYISAAEGFGLPVLEAAQMQCPMILSDDDAIQETALNYAAAATTIRGLSSYRVRTQDQKQTLLHQLSEAIDRSFVHRLQPRTAAASFEASSTTSETSAWNRQAEVVLRALTS